MQVVPAVSLYRLLITSEITEKNISHSNLLSPAAERAALARAERRAWERGLGGERYTWDTPFPSENRLFRSSGQGRGKGG